MMFLEKIVLNLLSIVFFSNTSATNFNYLAFLDSRDLGRIFESLVDGNPLPNNGNTTVNIFNNDNERVRRNNNYNDGYYNDNNYNRRNNIIQDNLTNFNRYSNEGAQHNRNGRYQNALQSYNNALYYRQSSSMYLAIGYTHRQLGNHIECIRYSNLAINTPLDRTNNIIGQAYINMALSQSDLGRYYDAINSYNSAIPYRYKMNWVYNNMGGVYIRLGQYSNAVRYLNMALNQSGSDHLQTTYTNLGVSYYNLGNYWDSARYFDQAVRRGSVLSSSQRNMYNDARRWSGY